MESHKSVGGKRSLREKHVAKFGPCVERRERRRTDNTNTNEEEEEEEEEEEAQKPLSLLFSLLSLSLPFPLTKSFEPFLRAFHSRRRWLFHDSQMSGGADASPSALHVDGIDDVDDYIRVIQPLSLSLFCLFGSFGCRETVGKTDEMLKFSFTVFEVFFFFFLIINFWERRK